MKRALLLAAGLAAALATSNVRTATQTVTSFAALSEQLSEPNGEFDTDNLISNESSYLHVIPALEQGGVTGGVYVGVGPDQNFSYIGRIRPAAAFIIDIRRDNLLLHLLFKAIFAASRTRVDYLAILTGRAAPDRPDTWRDASIEKVVMYFDGAKPLAPAALAANAERLHDSIRKAGLGISDRDLATIDRFHGQFIRGGLGLQFQSTGRPAREYYPTYRGKLPSRSR